MTVVDPPRRLNLACGADVRAGWHNVDISPRDGVDVHDLFRPPWDLPSEHYDLVEASHFLEHIPHRMGESPRDGFAQVMEEIHRILRPGGELVVRAPDWRNALACHSDPTHTRILTPRTWEYFSGFRYFSSARFDLVEHRVTGRAPRWPDKLRFGRGGHGLTVHLCARIPGIDRVLAQPAEHTYVLRRV